MAENEIRAPQYICAVFEQLLRSLRSVGADVANGKKDLPGHFDYRL